MSIFLRLRGLKLAMEAYEQRDNHAVLVSKARRGRALLKETLSGDAAYTSHDEEED